METQKNVPVKGMKISSLNVVMLVVALCISILLFISASSIKTKYKNSFSTMSKYSECVEALNKFRDTSEFLTNQARLFSAEYDTAFIENYFSEKDNLRTMEKSVEFVNQNYLNDEVSVSLKMALTEISILEKRELYSFKLIYDALEITQNVPQKINEVILSDEHKKLSKVEKLSLAKDILFDYQYLSSKSKVVQFSDNALDIFLNSFMIQQKKADRLLTFNYFMQIIQILALVAFSVIFFILLLFFVISPLNKHINSILKCKRMDEIGCYETQYIAKSYNALCDKNEVKASILKHKAEHDPLTGLINREAFNQIKEAYTTSEESIAYLLIDIDFFKKINDQHGHQVGDEVLKKISNLLMEQFRATDYVARIGGDEFAVIMTKIGPCPTETIQRKIDGVNMTLQSVEDGLPSVSLSVGVAFSDGGFKADLVDQADVALYRVKKGGRCNCSFFLSEE